MRRIGILTAALLALGALEARASVITYTMDFTFSGSPPASNDFPTITFDDGGGSGTVVVTISAGLTGTEYLDDVYFNVDDTTGLTAAYVSGTAANSATFGSDAHKADGDGYFDAIFDYPPPPGSQPAIFGAGETSVYNLSRAGLTAASFNFISSCGQGCGTSTGFFAAVHIQAIGPTGALSGWNGDGDGPPPPPPPPPPPNVVPEPGTMLLLGTGLVGLAAKVRQRRKP